MYIWETKSAYGKEKWLIEFWREARSMGEDDLDVVTVFPSEQESNIMQS